MSSWARIQDGIPVEVIGNDPTGLFHESIKWIEVPDFLAPFINAMYTVSETGSGKSKKEVIIPPSMEYFQKQLLDIVASVRWEKQVAGISINDVQHRTDKETINDLSSKILDGMLYEQTNGEASFITNWKAQSGFYDLSLVELQDIKRTCTEYVDACFEAEKKIGEAIYTSLTATNNPEDGYNTCQTLISDAEVWPDQTIVV